MSNNTAQDTQDFVKAISQFASIHRMVTISKQKFVLSVRVVAQDKTLSNQTLSLAAATKNQTLAVDPSATIIPPTLTTLSLLSEKSSKTASFLPRLLLTCSNMKDECFVCELPLEDLANHVRAYIYIILTWLETRNKFEFHFMESIFKLVAFCHARKCRHYTALYRSRQGPCQGIDIYIFMF